MNPKKTTEGKNKIKEAKNPDVKFPQWVAPIGPMEF